MSNDPRNPISNETGEYLQHVAEQLLQHGEATLKVEESDSVRMPAPTEEKPKPVKRTNNKR